MVSSEWTGRQSPDMNLIEHVWAILKANVAAHRPKTKKTLIKWIRREWAKLPTEYAAHLVDSMKQRLLSLIRANGDNTRY